MVQLLEIERLTENELTEYLITQVPSFDLGPVSHLEKAGEGNMNVVLRAVFQEGSLIVKQAKPYVQKYPSIAAPIERGEMEAAFYAETKMIKGVAQWLPEIYAFDKANHILVMEDLGVGSDFTFWYQANQNIDWETVGHLLDFLSFLHQGATEGEPLINGAMRRLNHAHIFDLPFRADCGFELNAMHDGLQNLAAELIYPNRALADFAAHWGQIYLTAKDGALLHGDYYPGSWLHTAKGLKIIDPEFGFTGPAAFDLGVMHAHLKFAGATALQIDEAFKVYGAYDHKAVEAFSGIETLRRLFGVAQLPLTHDLTSRKALTVETLKSLDL